MTPDASVWRLLADNLATRADHPALVDPGRSLTHAGLAAEAGRVAGWLLANGVRPGDRVVIQLRKSIEEVAAMFGAWRIGAVVVNVNAQWTAAQLAHVALDCGAAAAILGPRMTAPPGIGPVLRHGPGAPDDPWETLPPASPAEARPDPASLAMLIYTSGSTGRPKGVMLSHANIRLGAIAVSDYLGLGPDDRLLSILPYSFDAGLNQLTTMLLQSGTTVHQPLPMPMEILRRARDERVTGIAGVPPLWTGITRALIDAPMPLPDLRRITNTGGKIPPDVLDLMPRAFPGTDIVLMYGLTESFRSTYLPPAKFAAKKGSIGQAIPHAQVFLIRPDGSLAGPGEQGELVHAGGLVSMGYWGRPDLTAEKNRPCPALEPLIGPAPVVWSGDLVRMDAEGDLWFVGRLDEMIKTSGFRLSPTEVEDAAALSGLVAEAIAWGEDDAELGQAVHLAVTLLPDGSEAALLSHCRRTMPSYMQPRRLHLWPGPMPRTASGKLDRPAVKAACRAALPPAERTDHGAHG